MPYGDCTGPDGLGPRTGRALGRAIGNKRSGWIFNYRGRGFGRGFGYGRGFGRGLGRGRLLKEDDDYCVCPNCGYRIKHERGVPCATLQCPNCHSKLVRESILQNK
ncbi:MAG: H+/Na+-translocating ferredoxin:NAD+ oxidoreductase subunit [Candidatus Woesearchaeota archaeon]|nr:H+/Na+-translocating ferredoxin:NAD+ oxidoreductase subunit [Candidatus Woesearchaeota archaeon]MDN5327527.1 H+/Na+-translocating ferredoxin:NAD+ oxidoreductase subunit [Candidatus Woesearchaeota archaeon]